MASGSDFVTSVVTDVVEFLGWTCALCACSLLLFDCERPVDSRRLCHALIGGLEGRSSEPYLSGEPRGVDFELVSLSVSYVVSKGSVYEACNLSVGTCGVV